MRSDLLANHSFRQLTNCGLVEDAHRHVTAEGHPARVGLDLADVTVAGLLRVMLEPHGLVFTGSMEVGMKLLKDNGGRKIPRPVIIEMGGKKQERSFFNVGMAKKFMQTVLVADALAELQPYVPTSHADIAAGIRQIAEILTRIAS